MNENSMIVLALFKKINIDGPLPENIVSIADCIHDGRLAGSMEELYCYSENADRVYEICNHLRSDLNLDPSSPLFITS